MYARWPQSITDASAEIARQKHGFVCIARLTACNESVSFSALIICLTVNVHMNAMHVEDATVFGVNWSNARLGPGVRVAHSKHRNDDPKRSVDHRQSFTFALIIENCDARGAASEKIYDCFSAGCIPLYDDAGNNSELTDIPRDMYIEVRQFESSQQLQHHIDSLTNGDVTYITEQRLHQTGRGAVPGFGASTRKIRVYRHWCVVNSQKIGHDATCYGFGAGSFRSPNTCVTSRTPADRTDARQHIQTCRHAQDGPARHAVLSIVLKTRPAEGAS